MGLLSRHSVLSQQTDSFENNTQVAMDNYRDSRLSDGRLADLINTIGASHRSQLERTVSQLESGT